MTVTIRAQDASGPRIAYLLRLTGEPGKRKKELKMRKEMSKERDIYETMLTLLDKHDSPILKEDLKSLLLPSWRILFKMLKKRERLDAAGPLPCSGSPHSDSPCPLEAGTSETEEQPQASFLTVVRVYIADRSSSSKEEEEPFYPGPIDSDYETDPFPPDPCEKWMLLKKKALKDGDPQTCRKSQHLKKDCFEKGEAISKTPGICHQCSNQCQSKYDFEGCLISGNWSRSTERYHSVIDGE